ncbi:S-adenosylmethionine:tRNA ribosyltransferase-isomerase [Selenomonas sp. oral taxon 892 str. F0426]|jgi:S-adenosylmethionine:tRNA ribosyltransferase-isomerase|uniref:tRNA preQ1(34) S-adenosylmethionine ribosyltransferase-isomerase QueA n=1 Tax=Selenomonas sp. oral taxon 892 TaxID=1321785 RepID=UPI0003AD0BCE|nr:tRNA preQ1(34) S-adenosylmethionine ribosyltransferase-isomerase QueA [Selenomonas sp. oral taxon 892]ERJ92826.1 S-adenosylmethionine:tRNA ribosyltransferase-isomerase [Selenomonas sp. oral taxon 892 str. F0426]
MNILDFDYELPEERIAQLPVEPRDSSRLMVLHPKDHTIEHHHFHQLGEFLEKGDVLIFNDTRVIPARLIGARENTGGKVEIFLLRQMDKHQWEALVKPGKKVRVGSIIRFSEELVCEIIDHTDFGGRIVRFIYDGVFEEILDRLGSMPLPPYIHEKLEDQERYQTIYSRVKGSAAAPTAGLHFTERLMERLRSKGIQFGFITLHVGLGTFRPVHVETIEDHVMHREFYSVPAETAKLIQRARNDGRRVVAVGTTSIRTLEASAMRTGNVEAGSGWTDIFIYPGYQFNVVDAVVTNFHLPQSTLIMLISAFAGREFTLAAYRTAVEEQYRFFSFGDAMLIRSRE